MKKENQIKHLYNRAAFGLSFPQWTKSDPPSVKQLLGDARHNVPIDIIKKPVKDHEAAPGKSKVKASPMKKQDIVLLNSVWTHRFYTSAAVLREKMTLFWHDHFACRVLNPNWAQQQNNTLRRHALGQFGNLLMAISKDAAMLQFLNNKQNRKDSPNENFAREVLELFTLGRGHYTEEDIRNAARAFTGWTFNADSGQYLFKPKAHDGGIKTFRGKTGRFEGEEILKMIVDDQQTARFVTEKIWRQFVSEEIRDEEIITSLSRSFYRSDYNIKKLLFSIFNSDWFYEERFVGNRIKSPVELLAGIITQTGGRFENPESLVFVQRALGHVLFLPPNVGGWPSGKLWIDSSSLSFRMSLPGVLFRNSATDFEAKDDGDANNDTNKAKANKLVFHVDWKPMAQTFTKGTANETLALVEEYLLSKPTHAANRKLITAMCNGSVNDLQFLQKAFTGYMSLPEYQLC